MKTTLSTGLTSAIDYLDPDSDYQASDYPILRVSVHFVVSTNHSTATMTRPQAP